MFAQQWIEGCVVCFEVREGRQGCLEIESADRMADSCAGSEQEQLWLVWSCQCCPLGIFFLWLPCPEAQLDFPAGRLVEVLLSNADAVSVDSALRNPWYFAHSCKDCMFCMAFFIMWEELWKKIQIGQYLQNLLRFHDHMPGYIKEFSMTEKYVQQQYK